jgi:long-chain acyl-CoA synthetase
MFSTPSGREHPTVALLPQPEDTYIICYTSGTTGLPKGVQLTHANLVANISSFYVFSDRIHLRQVPVPGDSSISYLPLSHMFEQAVHWYMFSTGASIGYSQVRVHTHAHTCAQGDVRLLMDDIAALRPHFLPVVPRLLNRMYDKVTAGVHASGTVTRAIFKLAYAMKLNDVKVGVPVA